MKALSFSEVISFKPSNNKKKSTPIDFEKCVEVAIKLKEHLSANRMAIAEIAERVCILRHGGDVKTKQFKECDKEFTLKFFCSKVGLNIHTVSRWIVMKNEVYCYLPRAEQVKFNYAAGDYAARDIRKNRRVGNHFNKEKIVEIYKEYADSKNTTQRRGEKDALSYLGRAAHILVDKGIYQHLDESRKYLVKQLVIKISEVTKNEKTKTKRRDSRKTKQLPRRN